ncbi:hypothetical protein F444_14586, partial [Phytophthora nicotianae P1976]
MAMSSARAMLLDKTVIRQGIRSSLSLNSTAVDLAGTGFQRAVLVVTQVHVSVALIHGVAWIRAAKAMSFRECFSPPRYRMANFMIRVEYREITIANDISMITI